MKKFVYFVKIQTNNNYIVSPRLKYRRTKNTERYRKNQKITREESPLINSGHKFPIRRSLQNSNESRR